MKAVVRSLSSLSWTTAFSLMSIADFNNYLSKVARLVARRPFTKKGSQSLGSLLNTRVMCGEP